MSNEITQFSDLLRSVREHSEFFDDSLPTVCVQGLGFVGIAMAIAIASARDGDNKPIYNVIGIDLPNKQGIQKVDKLNSGALPIEATDPKLVDYLEKAHKSNNFAASVDSNLFKLADIVLVDIHLDVIEEPGAFSMGLNPFREAIKTLGKSIRQDCLVIVETTVPPGCCQNLVLPELELQFVERGLDSSAIQLAHSYERVMPGKDYLDSIINYWRVYSGHDKKAADRCEAFLSNIINTRDYPLTRLHNTTASETAKVLENSFRAMNIAFIDEWSRFAEAVGIDLFQVTDAISTRPTHKNIMKPGFGVGGYCLTKDPLFAKLSAKEFFSKDIDFPMSTGAVKINREMPLASLTVLNELLENDLGGKKILLMGVSYRQDVGDTRYSPSETFLKRARENGAIVDFHDPLVDVWEELGENVMKEIPNASEYDAVIFAVPHKEYKEINFKEWLQNVNVVVLDACNVISEQARSYFRSEGIKYFTIGRGVGL
jgi:nucleotide sugar dehydrogenase